MNENEKNIRKNFLKFTESRYMKFVGGNDLVFSLIALVLLGIVIFIFEKVSYVFDPFIIVFKTIAAPIIVSLILFYLFNPIVNMMERYRIPRVAGISIIYLAVVGVITLIVNLLIPIIGSQVDSLVKNSPQYLEKLINSIDKIANN
ncbi:TPA: AI-2E family transporter, partial [Staphylococcus aureus]|nr:AI-2E family transporter [Staphylococcus aureus]